MLCQRLLTIVLGAPILLIGLDLPLCLDDQSKLSRDDLSLVTRMVRSAVQSYKLPVAIVPSCDRPGTIRLTITIHPFGDEAALGATRVSNGSPIPEIYVFRGPIQRMLPSKLALYEARGITTVAIHELLHYLSRRTDHDPSGIFAHSLSPAFLIARSFD